VYISDYTNKAVYKYEASSGTVTTLVDSATLSSPYGVAVDSNFDVYIADAENVAVYKYEASSGTVTTLVDSATLSSPNRIAVDSNSDVYIADITNKAVYKYEASPGNTRYLQSYDDDASIGWFMCADEAQSAYPTSTAEALGDCSLNGIAWQREVLTTSDVYFFSTAEALAYAISVVNETSCVGSGFDDIMDTICDYVLKLPPFSCSRDEYEGTFDIIGTAYGNSELLYISLVVVLARLLWILRLLLPARMSARATRRLTIGLDAACPRDANVETPAAVEMPALVPNPMNAQFDVGALRAEFQAELRKLEAKLEAKHEAEMSQLRTELRAAGNTAIPFHSG
jgi:hypothetical protein